MCLILLNNVCLLGCCHCTLMTNNVTISFSVSQVKNFDPCGRPCCYPPNPLFFIPQTLGVAVFQFKNFPPQTFFKLGSPSCNLDLPDAQGILLGTAYAKILFSQWNTYFVLHSVLPLPSETHDIWRWSSYLMNK